MKKYISIILVALICIGLFASCSEKAQSDETDVSFTESVAQKTNINIAVLKGPTGMGAAKLMEMNENDESKNSYNFTVATAPDQITAKLVSGELDMACIPSNAASALYNKTKGGVTLVAVNTLGVLYILENGDSVENIKDLTGKKILASGKGSTAEYVLNYIIEKNGIKDVTVEYAAEHSEAAAQALSGKYDIVMLPEPFVTSTLKQNEKFKVKIDLTKEWKKLTGSELTMGAVAVRTNFYKENSEAVKNFLEDYKTSVDFTNYSIDEAAILIEKYDIAASQVAKSAIPNCNIVLITGEEMKKSVSGFLEVISEFDASAIGGALPGDDFYYLGK